MDLEKIYSITDENELKEYIDFLVSEFEKQNEDTEVVGFENLRPHKGIIPRNTIISNVEVDTTFTNNEYAYEFVNKMKKYNVHELRRAMEFVYYFVRYYFGRDGSNERKREFFPYRSEPYPLDMFRKKSVAVCSERAALSQNLMSLLGVESYFVIGTINGGNHAYNIIHHRGDYYLYDTASDKPRIEDGKIVDYVAFIKKLTPEEFESLCDGHLDLGEGRDYTLEGNHTKVLQ